MSSHFDCMMTDVCRISPWSVVSLPLSCDSFSHQVSRVLINETSMYILLMEEQPGTFTGTPTVCKESGRMSLSIKTFETQGKFSIKLGPATRRQLELDSFNITSFSILWTKNTSVLNRWKVIRWLKLGVVKLKRVILFHSGSQSTGAQVCCSSL